MDEASQRRYAALETLKLGYGGKTYIKKLLGISYDRIRRGLEEYKNNKLSSDRGYLRKKGGGRKGKKTMPE